MCEANPPWGLPLLKHRWNEQESCTSPAALRNFLAFEPSPTLSGSQWTETERARCGLNGSCELTFASPDMHSETTVGGRQQLRLSRMHLHDEHAWQDLSLSGDSCTSARALGKLPRQLWWLVGQEGAAAAPQRHTTAHCIQLEEGYA